MQTYAVKFLFQIEDLLKTGYLNEWQVAVLNSHEDHKYSGRMFQEEFRKSQSFHPMYLPDWNVILK